MSYNPSNPSQSNVIKFTSSGRAVAMSAIIFYARSIEKNQGIQITENLTDKPPSIEFNFSTAESPELALAHKKAIYALFKQSYMDSNPPMVTVNPPYELKGFKTEEDLEEEKIDEFRQSFNSIVLIRRDNREEVITAKLNPPKTSPQAHMRLDPNQPFADQDSGYLSVFKATDHKAINSTMTTVYGKFIHVILLPQVSERELLDHDTEIVSPEKSGEKALLLNTGGVTKLFVQNSDGEQVPDHSGTRRIDTHEYLFCGEWPQETKEINIDMSKDEKSCDLLRSESRKQGQQTELNLEDPAAFIYKLQLLKAADDKLNAEKKSQKDKAKSASEQDVEMKDVDGGKAPQERKLDSHHDQSGLQTDKMEEDKSVETTKRTIRAAPLLLDSRERKSGLDLSQSDEKHDGMELVYDSEKKEPKRLRLDDDSKEKEPKRRRLEDEKDKVSTPSAFQHHEFSQQRDVSISSSHRNQSSSVYTPAPSRQGGWEPRHGEPLPSNPPQPQRAAPPTLKSDPSEHVGVDSQTKHSPPDSTAPKRHGF